jgi:hypothetical protein
MIEGAIPEERSVWPSILRAIPIIMMVLWTILMIARALMGAAKGERVFLFIVDTMWVLSIPIVWLLTGTPAANLRKVYYVPHLVTAVVMEFSSSGDHVGVGRSIRQRLLTMPNFPLRDEFAMDLLDGTETVIQFLLRRSAFRVAGRRQAAVGRLFNRAGP